MAEWTGSCLGDGRHLHRSDSRLVPLPEVFLQRPRLLFCGRLSLQGGRLTNQLRRIRLRCARLSGESRS